MELIRELVERYPSAAVAAANHEGLLVPFPRSIALNGQHVLEGRSLLESVVQEDRLVVTRMFIRLRTATSMVDRVRLLGHPGACARLHFVNLFESHGVAVAILTPDSTDPTAGQPVRPAIARTRFASYRVDSSGVVVDVDETSARMLDHGAAELVGVQGLDLVHPDDQLQVVDAYLEALATKRPVTMRYRHCLGSGGWLWVDGTYHDYLGQPDRNYVLVELIDVSETMAAKEALEAQELLLNRLAQVLPVGVLQVGAERRLVYANDRLHEIFGSIPTDVLDDVLASVDEPDRQPLESVLSAALAQGVDGDVDLGLRRPDGERRRCCVSVRTLMSATGAPSGAIACVTDTTEAVAMRNELEDRATFDVLTRCYNRSSVMSELRQVLAAAGKTTTGVIFVDLDRFKPVNDELGHAVGDELLVAVAGRFRGCLRVRDVLGRIGGDEFLVVCPDIGAEELLGVARRLGDSLGTTFTIGAHSVDVGASIGVALSCPGTGADGLVAIADEAMYQSKREGRGSPVLGGAPLANPPVATDQ